MTDLISGHRLMSVIKPMVGIFAADDEFYISYNAVLNAIEYAPSIDAVPVKHGKWIDVMTEEWCTFDECKCSVCGVVEYFNKGWKKFSYCPNCGAKMERSEE